MWDFIGSHYKQHVQSAAVEFFWLSPPCEIGEVPPIVEVVNHRVDDFCDAPFVHATKLAGSEN
jgi:hypothetical protein